MSDYLSPEHDALEPRLDAALRQGLRDLPVPTTSPDFDRRVLQALEQPCAPWWRAGWEALRPVLTAGVCSLVAALALLHYAAAVPAGDAPARPAAVAAVAAVADPAVDVDTLVEAAARRRAALRAVLSAPVPRAADRPASPSAIPAEPDRRSQVNIAPLA